MFVLFIGPNFSRKNLPEIQYIFRFFFSKNNVLRFQMVTNEKILKNFDQFSNKNPNRPISGNLENFWNFDPQNPQN